MKNKFPVVSVLMTVYNREKYLPQAIESVLNSTYSDFELIIVDDKSADASVAIAREYEKTDSRIRVYVNERNLGDYPNRNMAASYAKGKFLKYLDADDVIYKNGLADMVDAMEQFPDAGLGLCHSIIDDNHPYPYKVTPREAYEEHFLGRGLFNYGPSALIFRTDIFHMLGGFSGERYLGDAEFLLRAGAKYPVVKIAPARVWWRQHQEQEIVKGIDSGYYMLNTYRLNISFLCKSCPLSNEKRSEAIKRQKRHHARKIISLFLRNKKPALAYKVFKDSKLGLINLIKGLSKYN